MDCVARGGDKEEWIEVIKNEFEVNKHNAERIVRTELAHVLNEGAAERYEAAGIKYYSLLAIRDSEKTCGDCKELDGKIYKLSERKIGVNYPPIHPNCRCSVIPILKEDNNND